MANVKLVPNWALHVISRACCNMVRMCSTKTYIVKRSRSCSLYNMWQK